MKAETFMWGWEGRLHIDEESALPSVPQMQGKFPTVLFPEEAELQIYVHL